MADFWLFVIILFGSVCLFNMFAKCMTTRARAERRADSSHNRRRNRSIQFATETRMENSEEKQQELWNEVEAEFDR